jgi:hypothetical protein
VPGGLSLHLATLIWVDTLICLRNKQKSSQWAIELATSLDAVAAAFAKWLQINGEPHIGLGELTDASSLSRFSDASYAFALLIQSGRLTPERLDYQQAQQIFCAAINARTPEQMQSTDHIYCGLQLARHCGDVASVQETLRALIKDIQNRYESDEYSRAEDHFHSIVLRLLINFHGGRLRDALLDTLLQRGKEHLDKLQYDLDRKQQLAFEEMILSQIQVNLTDSVRLSGSEERGAVYRVRFRLKSDATRDDGQASSWQSDRLRLIAKKGSYDALRHSIDQYQKLPEALQFYFAKHTDNLLQFGETQEWYLIMEDLVHMSPLSEVLSRLNSEVIDSSETEELAKLTNAVSDALQAVHIHDQHKPILGKQFWQLYYTPITKSVEQLCADDAYPRLKRYLHGRFVSNGWRYRSFQSYLDALTNHADKLNPPKVGLTHGDCHSRNIMLDSRLSTVKFVDLEMLQDDDDYLNDYGLLLEDVAIYLYLPHLRHTQGLTIDDVVALPDPVSHTNAINYPILPRDSETIIAFQHLLLQRLKGFADQIDDKRWKERLWLAIVRNLLILGSRQTLYHEKDPRRHEERYRSILVCFAEAARLLNELIVRLDTPERGELPEIPFTGQLRAPLPPPFPLRDLRQAIMTLDPRIDHHTLPDQPYVTEYMLGDRVLAKLNTGKKPVELLLPGQLNDYTAPFGLFQITNSEPGWLLVVLKADLTMNEVLNLIRQAINL